MPTAWLQRTAFPTIMSLFAPGAEQPAPWELEMGFSNLPYQFPNQRMEFTGIRPGVRIGWMRSVTNIFHAFSANSTNAKHAKVHGIVLSIYLNISMLNH